MNAPGSDPRLIDSPATAAEALRGYFLANADRGDNVANDELVAELVRLIRARQASGDGVADAHDTATQRGNDPAVYNRPMPRGGPAHSKVIYAAPGTSPGIGGPFGAASAH